MRLDRALEQAQPDIFNTDQGCQFTSHDFLAPLQDREIKISMDGKGRALDNIFGSTSDCVGEFHRFTPLG